MRITTIVIASHITKMHRLSDHEVTICSPQVHNSVRYSFTIGHPLFSEIRQKTIEHARTDAHQGRKLHHGAVVHGSHPSSLRLTQAVIKTPVCVYFLKDVKETTEVPGISIVGECCETAI